MSDLQWDKMFQTNVKATWQVVKDFSGCLRSPGGSVLIVGSVAAFSPGPPLGVYGVTKTALLGLVKDLAKEMGKGNE